MTLKPFTMFTMNDYTMPCLALGTYECPKGQMIEAVKFAIDCGFRHFDCAWIYGNEADVGYAINYKIQEKKVERNQLFISTKLWNNFHKKEKVVEMLQDSLRSLGLSYVDLYIMHSPMGFQEDAGAVPIFRNTAAFSDVDYIETWEGMEECVNRKLTKSIGLCNFNIEQITRILQVCKIKPVVNQVELHPYMNQKEMREFCLLHGILVAAYCPLGLPHSSRNSSGFPDHTLDDHRIQAIANKYDRSATQIVFNYLVSALHVVVIVKSIAAIRIKEAIESLTFGIDVEDVRILNDCNTNNRICPLEAFVDHPHYPFHVHYH